MIQLIPLDESALDGLIGDIDGGLRAMVSNRREARKFLRPLLGQLRDFQQRTDAAAPWPGYLAIEPDGRRLVGTCAFKSSPNAAGEIEIAYETAPQFEGLGYATQMARALVAIAFRAPEVRQVFAHTLPDSCVSTRVLRNAGLRLNGEVLDGENGRVWRWEIARRDLRSAPPRVLAAFARPAARNPM